MIVEAGYAVRRQSVAERIYRAMGFGMKARWSPDDEAFPTYAVGAIITETRIHFDWRDRLRILLTGDVHVSTVSKTDVPVKAAMTVATISTPIPRRFIG